MTFSEQEGVSVSVEDTRIRQGYPYPPRISVSAKDIRICKKYPFPPMKSVSTNEIRFHQGYSLPPRISVSARDFQLYPSLRVSVTPRSIKCIRIFRQCRGLTKYLQGSLSGAGRFQDLKKAPCGSNSISKADCLWLPVPLVFFPTNSPVIGCCCFELHPTIIDFPSETDLREKPTSAGPVGELSGIICFQNILDFSSGLASCPLAS